LSKISDNGNSQIVKIARKGELLGKRSLISEESTNLDAIALTDMELCFIPKEKILELSENKSFMKALLINISNELKKSDNEFVNLAQKSVKQRLSHVLIYLNNEFGNDSEGFISLYLKRKEIGDLIGTSKEGCIRMLSSFKEKKLIDIKGKRIKIINKDDLSKIDLGLIS
jgi:CRP-like cAMP-binding protein